MKRFLFAPMVLVTLLVFTNSIVKQAEKKQKPQVCLTYDDGNTSDVPGYHWDEWNQLLLTHLKNNKIEAILFAAGKTLDNERGKQVLSSWAENNQLIGNHTYSHPSYHKTSYEEFTADFIKNDSLINTYKGYIKLFRFPYLKEGNTEKKRDDFRSFLKEQHYRNGYVTIDASDWFYNSRLLKYLAKNPKADIKAYRQAYLDHIFERATYYNDLSIKLNQRQIKHSLLLHHNLAAALFTDDVIKMFRSKGWAVINASEAYTDEIYTKNPNILPAGESLIWGLAKENGGYENILRYPGEDSKYEEPKMSKLGL